MMEYTEYQGINCRCRYMWRKTSAKKGWLLVEKMEGNDWVAKMARHIYVGEAQRMIAGFSA
jgi:hypothetical protein